MLGLYYANKVGQELNEIIKQDKYVEIGSLYYLYWSVFWLSTIS